MDDKQYNVYSWPNYANKQSNDINLALTKPVTHS